jgi:hypothetical protein
VFKVLLALLDPLVQLA